MKRVLFVDDDIEVLDGLRLRLYRHCSWNMTFVDSAERALQECERQPFDVIVTDLRMPRTDGYELLRTVSEKWPQMTRIVLSGYAQDQLALGLAPLAHQFLSKPCDSQQLEQRIERCLSLHTLLRRPELRALVGRIGKLPALPSTYARLQSVMCRDDACVSEVARIVSADTAIAGKVLQMVNSAFFRLARRITSVEQAVLYLGFAAVRNLVLSVEVFSEWSQAPGPKAPDLERLQQHVQRVAAAAAALAAGTSIAEDTLLAALLHDIGYWVLAQQCPREIHAVTEIARARDIPMHVAEGEVLGASHQEIGAYLLGLWGMPYSVIEAVAHHHTPYAVQHSELDPLTALGVAHVLAGPDDGAAFGVTEPAEPDMSRFQSLPMPFDWTEARRRVDESLKVGE
jgi:HD-like signal output (HDOD) protein